MKKKLSFVLALILLFSCVQSVFPAFAAEENPIEYLAVSESEVTVSLDDIGEEKTYQLKAQADRELTDADDIRWSSLNDKVAEVDQSGLVTAKSIGECDIVLRLYVGGEQSLEAQCRVTVRYSVNRYYTELKYIMEKIPSDMDSIPARYPSDKISAVTEIINNINYELEDTDENCEILKIQCEKLDKAITELKNSRLAMEDDDEFWGEWNKAVDLIPDDFYLSAYTEESAKAVQDILDEVHNRQWFESEKDKIDELAQKLIQAIASLKSHTTEFQLPATYTASYGEVFKIRPLVNNGYDKIKWTSSDESVAVIDGDGNIRIIGTCKNPKSPYIIITAEANSILSQCILKVENPVRSIKASERITMFLGTNKEVEIVYIGADGTENITETPSLTWYSSNDAIATVKNGVITPVSVGDCVITAECSPSIKAEIKVQVKESKKIVALISAGLPSQVTLNDTVRAKLRILPAEASNKEIEWTSSDESIVKVINEGTDSNSYANAAIVGVSVGKATVTYKTTDGSNIEGAFTVTVNPLIESITLSETELMLYLGDTDDHRLTATILPKNAGNQTLDWYSTDDSVAEVVNGKITIKSTGECEIQALSRDGSGISATCKVKIYGGTNKITLNKTSADMKTGETLNLTASVLTDQGAVYSVNKWTTSNEKLATVDSSGKVKALLPGEVEIKAVALDGTTKTCKITITADLLGISMPSTLTLNVGKSKTVIPTFNPTYASNQKVTYKSSKTSVATVSTSGKITAIAKGTATITVTSEDGGYTATCKVVVTQPVTGIKISKTSYTLTMGSKESVTLTATISPSNASTKTVTWKSSNTKVAKVSSSGKVTAVGPGKATITVTSNDGGYKETCTVTVIQPLKSVKFSSSNATFYVGQKSALPLVFTPSNASNKNVTWKSSDTKIATVDSDDKITAVKTGKCTITVKAKDGGYSAKCTLTVVKKVNVTSVKLNKSSVTVNMGKTYTLKPTVSPSNASNKNVTWSSSNPKVATVNSKGVVTAVKGGKAVITCKTKDQGKTYKCTVTVYQSVSKVTLSAASATIIAGKTKTLTATVSPSSATNKAVKWSSSDTSIATVDSNGKIKALKGGTVTITAKSKDNTSIKATCKVTILQTPKSITLSETEISILRGSKFTLAATVKPNNTYDKSVTWKSSKTSVARVSASGVITAVSAGTTTITCTSTIDPTVKRTCTVTVIQPVTGIKLSYSNITLTTGKTKTLTPTISPSNATNKKVTYKTSDKNVVTVNSKGVLEAIGPGKATITVTTKDGFYSAKCTVNVIEPVVGLTLDKASVTIALGKSKTLTATVKPKNATNKDVKWTSSNSRIARVTQSGKITALQEGTVTITCTTVDGNIKAKCTVKCIVPTDGVELSKTSVSLQKGKTKTLSATVSPTYATIKDVSWTSSNTKVATVDKNGKVTAVGKGTAIITCTTKNGGYKATCTVKVTN